MFMHNGVGSVKVEFGEFGSQMEWDLHCNVNLDEGLTSYQRRMVGAYSDLVAAAHGADAD